MDTLEKFRFISKGIDEKAFRVVRFSGTEGLNKLYRFEITLATAVPNIDLDVLLRSSARFIVVREGEKDNAVFTGMLSSVTQGAQYNAFTVYTVVLQPKFWKLTQVVQNKIYLDKTVQEIVKDALNFDPTFMLDTAFKLTAENYPKQDFSLQYNETIYTYIANKLETDGVYYYFAQHDDGEQLVFTDAHTSHAALPTTPTLRYSPVSGLETAHIEEVITAFSLRKTPLPKKVVLRAYDWKKPNTPLIAQAPVSQNGLGDVYYSDILFETVADGERLAQIRAEELRCRSAEYSGTSMVPTLRPGFLFTLQSHYQANMNSTYMLTEVTHEGSQEGLLSSVLGLTVTSATSRQYYRNTFTCIESSTQFRPARVTPRGKMQGLVTAFIDGAGTGERPELDSYGRYKVIFSFDTSGRKEGNASCWLRMCQPHVGKGYGMVFPLTAGIEVTVAFVDGNPDRPLITGALANTETGPLCNDKKVNTSGVTTASGNALVVSDSPTNPGIALTPAGAGGISMTPGAITTQSDVTACVSTLLSSSLGGMGNLGWSAFRSTELTGMGLKYTTFMIASQIAAALGSTCDALAENHEGWDAIGCEMGAKGSKGISLALQMFPSYLGKFKDPSYGYVLQAKGSGVRTQMLQAPTLKEFLLHGVAGLITSIGGSGLAVAGEVMYAEDSAKAKAVRHSYTTLPVEALTDIMVMLMSLLPVYCHNVGKEMGGILMETDSNIFTHSIGDTFITSTKNVLLSIAMNDTPLLKKAKGKTGNIRLGDYVGPTYGSFINNSVDPHIILDSPGILQRADSSFETILKKKRILCGDTLALEANTDSPDVQALYTHEIALCNDEIAVRNQNIALLGADDAEELARETDRVTSLTQRILFLQGMQNRHAEAALKLVAADNASTATLRAKGDTAAVLLERSNTSGQADATPAEPLQTVLLQKNALTITHKPVQGTDIAEISLTGADADSRKIVLNIGTSVLRCAIELTKDSITLQSDTASGAGKIVLNANGITLSGKTITLETGKKKTVFTENSITFPNIDLRGGTMVGLG